ncbi:hypothetical protein CVIRNUC_009701 [Coccomyxa viridis]|uniref:Uncharacterized protein n=1 Tax=Coccomyxa viridis TaxID=1274662 RepID=A0AAV1IGQ3_9CHLO|nr:hypothetical protein CVIRNUC_009701 [Coccomyxa viridis]
MAVREVEALPFPFPVEEQQAVSHPGADLGHIEALLSDSWPISRPQTVGDQPRFTSAGKRRRREASSGRKRSCSEGRASLSKEAGPSSSSSAGWASSSHEGTFCKLCDCWVPGEQGDGIWQQHVHSQRHRRSQSTSNYRKYVLPEKKAAAEELRIQMAASKTPSLGSAARAAAAVRSEHEDRIQSLYADVCKEMLHHSGASGDYHRLVSRLSPDRLAVAMPYTATRVRSNVGPEGSLTFLSASPATIACLAALLPETHATTLVLSVASGHALDLAASTAALCLLVGRLRGAPQLRRLQISMLTVMEESGYGMPGQEHIVERHSQLEKRVLRALRDAMQYTTSLRLLSLKASYASMLALDWADLQAAAAQAPARARLALLMGLHSRCHAASPLVHLPHVLLSGILDMVLPATPCRVFLS